ncbi:MAG TPA: ATP-binding cassette domain-containing protein [Gemmataceae bacterium]|nr:ATP-binding cassette domain-containing protein [Gemmataceae bacterium]
MIEVSHLTKYYGDYAAVRDVSFHVPAGQIVGFLGPNGAGKSTTMRMLAGYITATSGKATIAGLDVFWNSVEVRRKIGYMPESCPLYTEMRVEEYLDFRAGIKGIYGSERRKRLGYVMDRCWLDDVSGQIIGTLSKGYRQRVGRADALLANPPVLILDEPTAGLDPTQIRSARTLIRELGQQHTILLSTHILSEVEATCNRVIIIHRGQVAASSSMEDFKGRAQDQAHLRLVLGGTGDPSIFAAVPGVVDMHMSEGPYLSSVVLRITGSDLNSLAPRLSQFAADNEWRLLEMRVERPTLEDLFVQITGEEGVYEAAPEAPAMVDGTMRP